jgi:hypothetical protein
MANAHPKELQRTLDRAYDALEGKVAAGPTIDGQLSTFKRELRRVLQEMEQELVSLAAELDVKDGRFVVDEANFARVSALREQIIEGARPELALASDYISAFDDMVGHVRASFDIMRVPVEFTRLSVDVINQLKADQFARFHELSTATREALRRSMFDAVLGSGRFDDFTQNVAASLRMDVPTGRITTGTGLVRRVNFEAQARTIAHDSITQHGAAVNEEAARSAGIDYFLYGGPLDGITRKFCADCIRGTGDPGKRAIAPRIYTRAARAELNNGQTGAGSVPIARGGYNCRHRWLPLTEEMAKEMIDAAEERGWGL